MTNQVIDCMMSHRSIRSYTDKAVSDEDLDSIIRAVQAAPNWVNLQLVSIIAIKNAERRELFSHLCGDQPHIAEAPVFLIFCADYNRVDIACKEKGQTLDEVMQDIDTVIVGAHETGIALEAAIESGWGQSDLASEHHNYFGLTAYGRSNVWWKGASIELGAHSLRFRTYDSPGDSFMDYARLIRSVYPFAADVSDDPKAFARKIAYSKYISEVNGDNRAAYQALLVKVCRKISKLIPHPINHNS